MKPLKDMSVEELRGHVLNPHGGIRNTAAFDELVRRNAALKDTLGSIMLEASMFRVDPPMSEEELMEKFAILSEAALSALEEHK